MIEWGTYGVAGPFTYGSAAPVTNAVANTKGNWAQLIASTPRAMDLMAITIDNAPTDFDYLVDIGIGAAGSEVVIIENILFSTESYCVYVQNPLVLPIHIPAGTRIAVRAQSSTGNKTIGNVILQLFANSWGSGRFSVVTTYGANTADSGGVSVDPGGVAWTWGAYSELTSSTIRAHNGLFIGVGGQTNLVRQSSIFIYQVAVGAAGAENPIYSAHNVFNDRGGNGTIRPAISSLIPVNIPVGTRLSVRCNSGLIDATDRLTDVVLYALS